MTKHRKAPRAGYIPYYVDGDKLYVMFMKPSNPKFGGDKFQIAKGKVESGETSEDAAKREAHEELGLKSNNLEYTKYLGTFLGYTDLFYGRVKDKSDFDPYTDETGATKWIEVNNFLKIGRLLHMSIIKMFIDVVIEDEPSLQSHQSEI